VGQHRLVAEALALDLGVRERGEEVVARGLAALGEDGCEQVRELVRRAVRAVPCGRWAGPSPVCAMSDNLALCERGRL